ncbi:Uncharacterised protein [Acholeplasma oculi]|uniref:Uncharacterized protein n=1 Tax=Acholeplasma oculi TaxID=35623 RepID=A0A061AB89_9MOLU|nr:hypothetical protein [Acholeplasma oculi]CDR30664.1 hypothetical protein Aocu_05910 [Acholeplasma oculi]SKC34618.1 hypothetical protein SAMN02745122_0017 [Acholeplasma oculi]SUT89437.1 Uncharacterised protein [Acholeplasma oculi]SUU69842.1 Uncharacterised protein [Acholeplasma oculi]
MFNTKYIDYDINQLMKLVVSEVKRTFTNDFVIKKLKYCRQTVSAIQNNKYSIKQAKYYIDVFLPILIKLGLLV